MEKEFNYTSLSCSYSKLFDLFDETKYLKLEVYFKQNEMIYHVTFAECLEDKKSDYEYLLNDKKYLSYEEFKAKLITLLDANVEIEILEINGDGPHYHNVFSKDHVDIEREEVITCFDKEESDLNSELVQTFIRPKHTWIMLENFIYLIVILFAAFYGFTSLFNYGADFFSVALIVLSLIMCFYCYKDYFKYRLEVYNDKIVYPHIRVKDFNVNFKNYREIKFKDINKVIYLNNPKSGKTTRELVVICFDGSQRVISLNVMNKNQYIDISTCLIEQLNNYHNKNKE